MRTNSKHFSLYYPTQALTHYRHTQETHSQLNDNTPSLVMTIHWHIHFLLPWIKATKCLRFTVILALTIKSKMASFFKCEVPQNGLTFASRREVPVHTYTHPCTPNEQTEFSFHVPWARSPSIASFSLSPLTAVSTPALLLAILSPLLSSASFPIFNLFFFVPQ